MLTWKIFDVKTWDVLTPGEILLPSVWAVKHRHLSRRQSHRPGRWKHENAPALKGLMDIMLDPRVEEISIPKAAQQGVSECVRTVIGCLAHTDPDPVLVVLPDQGTGMRIIARRYIPLFEDTPVLRDLMTDRSRDVNLTQIQLRNGFVLSLGWSGSPATLAADPQRVVVNDEVDKFSDWNRKESDPISQSYVRTQTYEENRLIINISTPTISTGMIWRRWESAQVKIWPRFACPHCSKYQRLIFTQVKWDKIDESDPDRAAASLEHTQNAWYECQECGEQITSEMKHDMLQTCRWATDDQLVRKDGTVVGEWPEGRRVGCHVWCAHSDWIDWYQIAAEFIRSRGDHLRMQAFRNLWLGEPYEEELESPRRSFGSVVKRTMPKGKLVPSWAGRLILTADTQKDEFWFVVRAWGHKMSSQLIHHGTVRGFDALSMMLDTKFDFVNDNGEVIGSDSPQILLIDSGGNRTDEVYQFALTDTDRIVPTKGASTKQRAPMHTSRITYRSPDAGVLRLALQIFDPQHYQDMLSRLIRSKEGSENEWKINDEVTDEYRHQMVSHHKVPKRTPRGVEVMWKPVSAHIADHLWDCETLQCVGADMMHVSLLPPPDTIRELRQPKRDKDEPDEGSNWMNSWKNRW